MCIRKYFYELSGIQALQKINLQSRQHFSKVVYINTFVILYIFGTLLFVWGLFLLFPLLSNLIAASSLTVYVLIGIQLEETKLFLEYGEEYEQY